MGNSLCCFSKGNCCNPLSLEEARDLKVELSTRLDRSENFTDVTILSSHSKALQYFQTILYQICIRAAMKCSSEEAEQQSKMVIFSDIRNIFCYMTEKDVWGSPGLLRIHKKSFDVPKYSSLFTVQTYFRDFV